MFALLLIFGCPSPCDTETIVYTESYTQVQLDQFVGSTNVDPSTVSCEELCDQDTQGDLSCDEVPVEGDAIVTVECILENVVAAC